MRRRTLAIFLGILLFCAFLVRVWGIHYGLEEGIGFHPDANWYANKALDLYRGIWPEPWYKESGWVFVQAGALYAASAFAYIFGGPIGVYRAFSEVNLSWEHLVLMTRLVNALFGAGTVAVVYLIGRRLFDERAGTIAALLQTFSLVHVLQAHNHYNETAMTFFFTLAFFAATRAFETGRIRDYLAVAVAGFLSGWMKRPGVIGLAFLPAVYAFRKIARREHLSKRDAAVVAIGVLFYAAVSVYWHSPRHLWNQLMAHYWKPLTPWPPGGILNTPWFLQLGNIHFYLGTLLAGATLLAVVWAVVMRNRAGLALLASAGYIFLVLGGYMHADVRFILPAFPFLSLLLAGGMTAAIGRIRLSEKGRALVLAAGTAALLAPSAYRIVVHDYIFWLPDTRILAGQWIRQHVPEGSTIWVEGLNIYNPPVYDGTYKLIGDVPPEEFAESASRADFYVASEIATQNNSKAEAYVRERGRLVKEFKMVGHQFHAPHIRIYHVGSPNGALAPLSALLPRLPGKRPGGFSVNFVGGGGYDREALSFQLTAGSRWSGVLVSPEPLEKAWVFVTNGNDNNRVSVGTGFLRGGHTLRLRPGETRIVEAALSRTFPYFSHFYQVSVKIGTGADGYVRVFTDRVRAAMACLEMGEPARALEIMGKARSDSSEGPASSIVNAVSAVWLERREESLAALRSIPGEVLEQAESISRDEGGPSWDARFMRATGLDWKAYAGSVSDAFDGASLSRETGAISGREVLFRDGLDRPGFVVFGPYVRYPPGEYLAEFHMGLKAAKGGEIARVDVSGSRVLGEKGVVAARRGEWESRIVTVPFASPSIRIPLEFRVRALGGGDVVVRSVVVRPRVEAAFGWWARQLKEAASGPAGRADVGIDGSKTAARFEGGIEHMGTRVDRGECRRGEPIRFNYEWRAVKPVRKEYEVFVHVEREGKTIFQQDHLFEAGARSVRSWYPGEVVKEEFLTAIPDDAPAGRYEVYVGLIDPNSRETVPASGEGATRDNRIRVASFEVKD